MVFRFRDRSRDVFVSSGQAGVDGVVQCGVVAGRVPFLESNHLARAWLGMSFLVLEARPTSLALAVVQQQPCGFPIAWILAMWRCFLCSNG